MEHQSNILIVDDDEFNRETLADLLQSGAYHLILAADGFEALTVARQSPPDLILLDVMMPIMDGFEACRQIRADPLLADIPVILVTALDDRESRRKGIEAGADDFISKPFDHIELRLRVKTITKLNRYRRLMAERTKFEWVVEEAKDGYLILEGQNCVQYANKTARNLLGIVDLVDVKYIDFLDLVGGQYRSEPQSAWNNWPEPEGTAGIRYLVRPESTTLPAFWLSVTTREIMPATNNGYLVHLQDVTDDILGERLSWAFHSQLNHKLGTSAELFSGNLELLALNQDNLDEMSQALVQGAVEASEKLKSHLMNIFSYIDDLNGSKFDNKTTLSQLPILLRNIQTDLRLTHLTIDSEQFIMPGSLPLTQTAIDLILRELLQNAIKFHPQSTPQVIVRLIDNNDELIVQVIDDGRSLAQPQLDAIWKPYYQAEKNFSGEVPGTGLGLARIAGICWEVNGSYRAFNRANDDGLVVEICLPIIRNTNSTPVPLLAEAMPIF